MRFVTPLLATLLLVISAYADDQGSKKIYRGEPIKALLITGGCCHNYLFQAAALTKGVEAYADIEWTIERDPRTGTKGKIELYDDPDWAKKYDVIVHNECFAATKDPEYIRKITAAHKAGASAVVIHCAMHTYRDADIDDWREFLGVTSKHHEHQSNYPVKIVDEKHFITRDFPKDWVTQKDELYIIKKLWPNAKALATSKSEKNGGENAVAWVNNFGKARVFGTTFGHSDDTFRDEKFINLVSRGIVWAARKDGGDKKETTELDTSK